MPENDNNNSNNNGNGSSWAAYQRLVLSEIARLDKNSGTLFKKIDDLDTSSHKDLNDAVAEFNKAIAKLDKALAVLQTKAAIYGAIGGSIFAGLIEFSIYFFTGSHK